MLTPNLFIYNVNNFIYSTSSSRRNPSSLIDLSS